MAQQTLVGRVRAPDFPKDIDWLNVERPAEHGGPEREDSHPGLLDVLLSQLHARISAVAETGREIPG